MKLKRWHKPYGLRARFSINLFLSSVLCVVLFFCLYHITYAALTDHFDRSELSDLYIEKQGESLQYYVDKHHITRDSLSLLHRWEKRQPVILLELYSGDECIYSSLYETPTASHPVIADDGMDHSVSLTLGTEAVTAVLYSDFTYQYYLFGTALDIAIVLIVFVLLFLQSNRKLIHYVCKLNDEVQILEGGNLEYEVSVQGNDEITDLARSMNRMRESLQSQIETEQNLHAAQRQLVTEMSHDLRTPLTGILLYLEILRSHRYETEAELQAYLEKIDAKAHHMKLLSDHLFEYTLDGTPPRQEEPTGMEQTFSEVIVNFCDDLNDRGFSAATDLTWEPCFVQVRREYLDRIFENLLSNITKYATPAAEVRVETIATETHCGLVILNTRSTEPSPADTNGIGLESIRSMMQQMKGIFTAEQTESVFEVTLLFPKQ